MKARTVSVWFGLALSAAFVCADSFTPHKVSFDSLGLNSPEIQNGLQSALVDVGLITVTEIPGFEDLRENILLAASECVLSGAEDPISKLKTYLGDGTARHTISTKSLGGLKGDLLNDAARSKSCAQLEILEVDFRNLVDDVTEKFVANVDAILGLDTGGRQLMLDTETNNHIQSVSQILNEGMHLEHFHTYEKFSNSFNFDYALDFHSDQGLFIAMAPALSLKSNQADHGFLIKLRDGKVVSPDFGDNNELVFMIGDGFQQWISPKVEVKFRATPHAVIMPRSLDGHSLRSWYGRMMLPKPSSFLEPQQMTFGEHRQKMTEGDMVTFLTACSDGLVSSSRSLMQCAAGTTACWHQCLTDLQCDSGFEQLCVKPVDDLFVECAENEQDHTCGLQCLETEAAEDAKNLTIGNDFCNGFNVAMYMQGFDGAGNKDTPCIVFLAQGMVLDSPGKFFLACVATVLIGIIVEGSVALRRQVVQSMEEGSEKTCAKLILYSTQVTFGYFAMLIAMTYSLTLFVMVVFGLTLGYKLFNFKVVPLENSDPCCPSPEMEKQESKSL